MKGMGQTRQSPHPFPQIPVQAFPFPALVLIEAGLAVVSPGGCLALAVELTPVCLQLDVSTYELERLHTKVTSLCNRIEQLQCHNAKDRLAQSGMVTPLPSSSLGQPLPHLGCS